jgi:hypothetical protein
LYFTQINTRVFYCGSDTQISSVACRYASQLQERIKRLEEDLMDAKNQYAALVADVALYEDRGERIKRLDREIELFREHADYENVCLVEAILKGEEVGRKENQNQL